MVTRSDVLKFLKALDDGNVQNRDFDGNVVPGKSVALREEYCKVFLEMFEGLDIQIWETTTRLVVERKKPWATPDEMVEYVSKVEAAYRAKQAAVECERVPQSFQDTFGEKEPVANADEKRSDKLKRMFELAKSGKFKEARDVFGGNWRIEATNYANTHFPDASEEWIEENLVVLNSLRRAEKICRECNSIADCKSKGYRQAGSVDKKTGSLSVVMVPCLLRKMESAENVSL